ncbi:hypothetical protein SAMN05444388_114102 [Flavobacterium johnsoniae]|uniref:Uncharacterized protein n=1 Tax=Flavobacterium johnsoniae TaxID=986 RepID=A0A1M5UQZ2_FLAJO|nr:hypothetical protein SAMN05444388_114102 [Flavobacterium johnsoniae]
MKPEISNGIYQFKLCLKRIFNTCLYLSVLKLHIFFDRSPINLENCKCAFPNPLFSSPAIVDVLRLRRLFAIYFQYPLAMDANLIVLHKCCHTACYIQFIGFFLGTLFCSMTLHLQLFPRILRVMKV